MAILVIPIVVHPLRKANLEAHLALSNTICLDILSILAWHGEIRMGTDPSHKTEGSSRRCATVEELHVPVGPSGGRFDGVRDFVVVSIQQELERADERAF